MNSCKPFLISNVTLCCANCTLQFFTVEAKSLLNDKLNFRCSKDEIKTEFKLIIYEAGYSQLYVCKDCGLIVGHDFATIWIKMEKSKVYLMQK